MNEFNANSKNRLKRMSPRLQKKLKVGDFIEIGFPILVTLKSDSDLAQQNSLIEAWLNEVEKYDISFGGHFADNQFEGIVFPIGQAKVDATVRQNLIQWLESQAMVEQVDADELCDIWHA